MNYNKNEVLFWTAMVLAVWFSITGTVWIYWAALFISYPAGVLSFTIWWHLKHENKRRNDILITILGLGLLLSLGILLFHFIFD